MREKERNLWTVGPGKFSIRSEHREDELKSLANQMLGGLNYKEGKNLLTFYLKVFQLILVMHLA